MSIFNNIFPFFVSVFFLQVIVSSVFRVIGSQHRHLVLADLFYCSLSGFCLAILLSSNIFILQLMACTYLMIVFLLQWFNFLTSHFYGIKLNLPILKIFTTGMGHFQGELVDTLKLMLDDLKPILFLLIMLPLIILICFADRTICLYSFMGLMVLWLAVFTKSKMILRTLWLWVVVLVVFEVIAFFLSRLIFSIPHSLIAISSVLIFTSISMLFFLRKKFKTPFMLLPNLLQEQFRENKIDLAILEDKTQLTEQDQNDVIALQKSRLQPSEKFGQCKGASIVLITMESVTDYYFTEEEKQQYMPFYCQLRESGVSSQCHISPSALTNNAMPLLYAGCYEQTNDYQHMQALKSLGYQTCFLTSQKTSEFNLNALCRTIGFEHIIDNVSFSKKPHLRLGDDQFFKHANELLSQEINLQKPFFVQVLNNQTHGPYFTYDKKILDRKQRYLQAVKESDRRLSQFVETLKKSVDNLIVVYTSDHGESFGEEGYMSHANSVVQPQLQVPFVISHPNLNNSSIKFSHHLSILPSIFDLLGFQYDYPAMGASIFNEANRKGCIAYSETKMGNTPCSFAYVDENKKIYFDRQRDVYEIRDHHDNTIETLEGDQYHYYLKLLLFALYERGLIIK